MAVMNLLRKLEFHLRLGKGRGGELGSHVLYFIHGEDIQPPITIEQ